MNTYLVTVKEERYFDMAIEANSPEEAEQKALEQYTERQPDDIDTSTSIWEEEDA